MTDEGERMREVLSKNLSYEPSLVPFPNFNTGNQVIYRFNKELYNGVSILKDLHSWSCRKKNQPKILPRYSDFLYNGENIQKIVCKCTDDEKLSKVIFNGPTDVFVIYQYTGSISEYKAPKEKIRRLEASDSEIIRQYLNGRTIADAKRLLEQAGYLFSTRQITNQARSCEMVKKTSSTGVITTDPMSLATYASLRTNCTFRTENALGKVKFVFTELYDSNLDLFFAAAPSILEAKSYHDKIDEILHMPKDDAKENIKQVLNSSKDGYQFDSGIFLDTTFGISDGFVTLIVGLIKHFRTKTDGKIRVLLLGTMISTTKEEGNHQEFANAFRSYALKNWGNKKVPFVMSDAETALRTYSETLDTHHLLCSVHLIDNLKHASDTKDDFQRMKRLVFGQNEDLTHSKCLLTSIDDADFERKLVYVLSKATNSQRNWLTKRRLDLRDKASWKARLQAGFFQHFPTNNILESFDNVVGARVTRKEPAEKLADILASIANSQHDQLLRAIDKKDAEVVYDKQSDFDSVNEETRAKLLDELGFKFTNVLSWEVPSRLQAHISLEKISRNLVSTSDYTSNDYKGDFIVESLLNGTIYHVKKADGGTLFCTHCKKADQLDWCIHILTVLGKMNYIERSLLLFKYNETLDRIPPKTLLRKASDKNSGRKTKRKYTSSSKHNRKRLVQDISISSMPNSSVQTTETDTNLSDGYIESETSEMEDLSFESHSKESVDLSFGSFHNDQNLKKKPNIKNMTLKTSGKSNYDHTMSFERADLSNSFRPRFSSTLNSEDSISTRTRARVLKQERVDLDETWNASSTVNTNIEGYDSPGPSSS